MTVAPQDLDRLTRLGVFARRGFLEPELCVRLRKEAGQAQLVPATISKEEGPALVDERTRRTKRSEVSQEAQRLVDERLAAMAPELAEHFVLDLARVQHAQFLVYRRGDFFRPHQDNSRAPTLDDGIRLRQLSVVVFLNRQTRLPAQDAFCGGALTFFMLETEPTVDTARTVVPAEDGLLVAFRSDVLHEVTPVTHGQRYSVVTWMVGPAPAEP